MTWLSDEVLSAYIDGELPAEEAARVALALTRDVDAVGRLDALRRGDSLLKAAYAWPLRNQAELSERWCADLTEAASPSGRVAALVTLAAVVVVAGVAVGFAAGQFNRPRDVRLDPSRGAIAEDSLARALDTQASDAAAALRIALTFRAVDGRYCRRFDMGDALQGVACRDGREWRLVALATPIPPTDGARAAPGRTAVDRAVEDLGVDRVLDLNAEADLISTGWKRDGARPPAGSSTSLTRVAGPAG